MVIQRIQTVYLLLAGMLMCVMAYFVPMGTIDGLAVFPYQEPVMLLMAALTAVLTFIDIFLFKTLKLQITVCKVCLALAVVTLGLLCYVGCARMPETYQGALLWPIVTQVVAIALLWLALRGMRSDLNKLRSYDRLW